MKLVLKRKEWHKLIKNKLSEENIFYEFVDVQEGCRWYDFGNGIEPVGQKVKGALPRMLNFSFIVKKINEDEVVLEVGGDAGTGLKGATTNIALKRDEERDFATKTNDYGVVYTLSLVKDDEKVERLPFRKFNMLFLTCTELSKAQMTIYPSLIYAMEDKYYNAAIKYLQNHIITELKSGEFKITDIMQSYWLDEKAEPKHYIEALIVLNTLEKAGDEAYFIYHPYVIE